MLEALKLGAGGVKPRVTKALLATGAGTVHPYSTHEPEAAENHRFGGCTSYMLPAGPSQLASWAGLDFAEADAILPFMENGA